MKALEFIYQDTQIHFLLQNDGEVMVNATEMAKAFGKRTDVFLKSDHAKAFLEAFKLTPYGGSLNENNLENVISRKGRNGIYFHRILSLKFAAWLDPKFEVWVYLNIERALFGNYKKHWDAHQVQEKAKERMGVLKNELIGKQRENVSQNKLIAYFEAENEYNAAGSLKRKAMRDQLKFEFSE